MSDNQSPATSMPTCSEAADYEQFIRLYTSHEVRIRAFVRSLLPAREHADEVMQETCIVLWRKFADFDRDSNFLAWACTVARFEVLKQGRRLARDRHVFNAELLELLADEAAAKSERREIELRALDNCIQRLPGKQRDLVAACYARGATIQEVARELGRSAGSLYKALNRIRAVLLDCMTSSLAREGVHE